MCKDKTATVESMGSCETNGHIDQFRSRAASCRAGVRGQGAGEVGGGGTGCPAGPHPQVLKEGSVLPPGTVLRNLQEVQAKELCWCLCFFIRYFGALVGCRRVGTHPGGAIPGPVLRSEPSAVLRADCGAATAPTMPVACDVLGRHFPSCPHPTVPSSLAVARVTLGLRHQWEGSPLLRRAAGDGAGTAMSQSHARHTASQDAVCSPNSKGHLQRSGCPGAAPCSSLHRALALGRPLMEPVGHACALHKTSGKFSPVF